MLLGHWLGRLCAQELRRWRVRFWIAVLALVALLLCQLPLLGSLGFEFCFVMAIVSSIAGADLGRHLTRTVQTDTRSPIFRAQTRTALVARVCLASWALTGATLVLPLVIVCLNGLRVRNCDWSFGLQCFALLPLLSCGVASAAGALSTLALANHKWPRRIVPFAILLGSLLLSLWRFYQAPAVFSYNPFAGYLPGNLYDEHIAFEAPFYWARLYQLSIVTFVGATFALFIEPEKMRVNFRRRPAPQSRKHIVFAVVAALASALLGHFDGPLGFNVSTEDVIAALPGKAESEHFTIHFPADAHIAEMVPTIVDDHEFRRAQLARDFDIDAPRKIRSFYFASPDQKHGLMGARNVYMAKPWREEIYLNHQEFPHSVVRHEIAHVMAGSFGDPVFRTSANTLFGFPAFFNVGLIEGIAVAADWPGRFDSALTPHQSVKAMMELGMAPPLHALFSTGFLNFSAARSYTVAGSFLRFLWDQYGIARLRQLYESGGDFERVYGRRFADLAGEWQAMIDATALPAGAAEIIRERFRRPSIFERPCAHALAKISQEMAEEAAKGDFAAATELARSLCRHVPAEPHYQLQLASLLVRDKKYSEAKEFYQRLATDSETISSTLRVRALWELATLAMHEGNIALATDLVEQSAALPLDDDDQRQADVLLQAITHQGPAGTSLRAMFWGAPLGTTVDRFTVMGLAAEAIALEPKNGLAHYMLGRQLRHQNSPEVMVRRLKTALALPLLPTVQREAARLLAEAAYLANDLDAVEFAAGLLLGPDNDRMTHLLAYDWLERTHWKQTGKVPLQPLYKVASTAEATVPPVRPTPTVDTEAPALDLPGPDAGAQRAP